MTKTIAIDFDGPIFNVYWDNTDPMLKYKPFVVGSLVHGAREAISKLKNDGWRIVIHTCRVNSGELNKGFSEKQLLDIIKNKLDENDVPYDEIWNKKGKPLADYYIDDNAIVFGNWEKVQRDIE